MGVFGCLALVSGIVCVFGGCLLLGCLRVLWVYCNVVWFGGFGLLFISVICLCDVVGLFVVCFVFVLPLRFGFDVCLVTCWCDIDSFD